MGYDAAEVDGSANRLRTVVWTVFSVAALLALNIDNLTLWAALVVPVALLLALIPGLRPAFTYRGADGRDLFVIGVLYVAVVGLFRLAFTVFTTDNILWLFLSFAFGLIIGVVGPIVYQVWMRGRDLRSLGLGFHHLGATLTLGLVFAAIQFASTLWGYDLPAPVDWVPLLVMSLVVGLFEAVFFRGFIQGRLEASFGVIPAVGGAAVLYALYHVGYGMEAGEMWFLFGLGWYTPSSTGSPPTFSSCGRCSHPSEPSSATSKPASSNCPGSRSSASPTWPSSWP